MTRFLMTLFVVIGLIPTLSHARDKTDGKSETLAVETMLCQKLATYQAGVDVNGNAVVPADLPSQQNNMVSQVIEVPLTIDLAKRLNLSVEGLEMRGVIGGLRLGTNGSVTYNGQDITQQTQILCDGGSPQPVAVPAAPQTEIVPADIAPQAPAMMQQDIPPLPATAAPSATSSP